MMTGCLHRWQEEKKYFPKAFDRALAFLLACDPLSLERKKHAIDGEHIFACVMEERTRPFETARFELHRDYLDIHVLHQGRERHGFSVFPPAGIAREDRLDEEDVAFYALPSDASSFVLEPGQYAVYTPWELHAPVCAVGAPQPIVKTVLKIHRSCLE